MVTRCPTCLEAVTRQTIVWQTADGTSSEPPPRSGLPGLRWIRGALGMPDRTPTEWADWAARGHRALCPRGHHLPADMLTRRTLTIGLVGESGSSKSHYIAALVQTLQQGHLAALDLQVDLDPATVRRYQTEYYSVLFERKQAIPASRPLKMLDEISGAQETRPPLTIVLRNIVTGEAVNVCIFDVAGEQLLTEQSQFTWARHLAMADGLMFFVDPAVLGQLPGGPAGDESGRGQTLHVTESVLDITSTLAHRGRGLSPDHDLTDVSAVVLLAKADLLEARASFPSGVLSPLDYDRETRATLDARLRRDSRAIESFLEDAGARNLVLSALHKYPGVRFHAVTATGGSAKDGRYPTVEPRRVLEPLLSILDGRGVISLGQDHR
jgi:hypothetical protein